MALFSPVFSCLSSDQSHEVPQTVLSLRAECNRLRQQKIDLEGKLDGIISLFARKQQELEAVMEVAAAHELWQRTFVHGQASNCVRFSFLGEERAG